MRTPDDPRVALRVVGGGNEAADDWIVERVGADDIVVTADIPLAARCLEKDAAALGTNGRPFTAANIGDALATRGLHSELRELGARAGGPPPSTARDRSRFLQRLDDAVVALRRRTGTG